MGCSIKNKKVEKVDEECFFNNEVIFARESEKNKYDCESNNKCRWKCIGIFAMNKHIGNNLTKYFVSQ